MIPIEIARLSGLLLGLVTGVLIFLLWRKYRKHGWLNWKLRSNIGLLAVLFFTLVASTLVEYNRAPIVKKISYRMERPKVEGAPPVQPVRQRVRMTERGSTLSILGPVYERQLIGGLLVFMLLVLFQRISAKTEKELIPVTPSGATKPLTIDREATLNSLQHLLTEERVYTNPGLSLEDLSNELGITRYQLSQLINEELHQNFYELINEKRVEEAISLMESDSDAHLTLSALGFEVGFNSKSSFYRAFKKKTGLTPAAFRKQLS